MTANLTYQIERLTKLQAKSNPQTQRLIGTIITSARVLQKVHGNGDGPHYQSVLATFRSCNGTLDNIVRDATSYAQTMATVKAISRSIEYEFWTHVKVPDPTGACAEVTEEMVEVFPELTRVRGHYHDPQWGQREHWWCVTEDGDIVDPTAHQFPSKGEGEYVRWIEGDPEPTGKCPECGEYTFNDDTFCSEGCGDDFDTRLRNEHA